MRHAIALCGSFISATRTSLTLSTRSYSPTSFSTSNAIRLYGGSAAPFISTPPPRTTSLPLSTQTSSHFSSASSSMAEWMQLTTQLTAQLEEKLGANDECHQNANKRSWALNAALVRVEMAHEASLSSSSDTLKETLSKEDDILDKLVRETVLDPAMYNNITHANSTAEGEEVKVHQRAPRLSTLGSKMEDYARYKAFRYFLLEEKLLSPNAPCFVIDEGETQRNILTDEEYLGGACIGLCHDLAKYGVTRASNAVDDETAVPFIKRARDAVSLILEELLQFDFRNGPLRRKYDGTKYALKMLETVLYELSVAGAVGGHESLVDKTNDVQEGGPLKKMKIDEAGKKEEGDNPMEEAAAEEEESSAIPKKEIGEIRERMDHRDKLREKLIKTSRDGQKAAKQAIFAMHRGDAQRASKLLNDCEKCVINDLLPILEEEPTLRGGSFSNILEEYVEGKLFYVWLHGDGEGSDNKESNQQAVGKVLLMDEIPLKITEHNYLGGLCDLTGEVGRYAVARGTVRDKESVKLCLDASKSIQMTLKMLGKIPSGIGKKMGMVGKSVEKLERVLYEQSLMEMTGRKEFSSSVDTVGFDGGGDDN